MSVRETYKYVMDDLAGEDAVCLVVPSNNKLQAMSSEGVPVANLYYSDSPWSCAGESMSPLAVTD